MGLYLNQLPPTEVARLKAELAETLIANFCYPRFYDYRVNALRMRPVDRAKRQEVWQYLNAVDFQVWGRVDVDSPEFQNQVERLFIHFVQRNRTFFGEQGRRRMTDVRSLITSCSSALAEGVRKHLQGKPGNLPLGTPRPGYSWATATGRAEPSWEQILTNTMQLQQQLQEVRGEARAASTPAPASGAQAPSSSARLNAVASNVPSRRSRSIRSAANGAGNPEEEQSITWPPSDNRPMKAGEIRVSGSFAAAAPATTPRLPEQATPTPAADAAPTLPLPLGKSENLSTEFQATRVYPEVSAPSSARPKRAQAVDASAPFAPPAGPSRRSLSQPLPATTGPQSAPKVPAIASSGALKPGEQAAAALHDEDVVIFEQMRYQLMVDLRVDAVRAGVDVSNNQSPVQLVEALRHQEGMDMARLQVASTLLKMCDQIITSGRATLVDYKQAMMFYLMHTRRSH